MGASSAYAYLTVLYARLPSRTATPMVYPMPRASSPITMLPLLRIYHFRVCTSMISGSTPRAAWAGGAAACGAAGAAGEARAAGAAGEGQAAVSQVVPTGTPLAIPSPRRPIESRGDGDARPTANGGERGQGIGGVRGCVRPRQAAQIRDRNRDREEHGKPARTETRPSCRRQPSSMQKDGRKTAKDLVPGAEMLLRRRALLHLPLPRLDRDPGASAAREGVRRA